jgi:hypothetical protein
MILARYVLKRYAFALLTIALLLGFFSNLIEFFEKLTRVRHAELGHLLQFLALNFLPSSIDLLPLAMWLATLVVLRDLTKDQGWDFLRLIGFMPRHLAIILGSFSIFLIILVGVARETIIVSLAQHAQKVRREHFKKVPMSHYINVWLELDANTFCSFGCLDLATSKGKDFVYCNVDEHFCINRLIYGPAVSIADDRQHVLIERGYLFKEHASLEPLNGVMLPVPPSVWKHLAFTSEIPTFITLCKWLFMYRFFLSPPLYAEMWVQWLKTVNFYLQCLLLPILTILLFGSLATGSVAWFGALALYPISLGLDLLMDQAVIAGAVSWVLFVPYLCLICLLWLLSRLA